MTNTSNNTARRDNLACACQYVGGPGTLAQLIQQPADLLARMIDPDKDIAIPTGLTNQIERALDLPRFCMGVPGSVEKHLITSGPWQARDTHPETVASPCSIQDALQQLEHLYEVASEHPGCVPGVEAAYHNIRALLDSLEGKD